MSGAPDAIRRTISVRCGVETAFRIWTERIDVWWPKSHSRSGDPATGVFLEGRVGGRLFERTPSGVEHVWGEVVAWDPPHHFAYHWYLGSGAERPTRVELRFVAQGNGETRVELVHRGPELIGEGWERTSPRFAAAWEHVLPAYIVACQEEGT